MNLPPKKIARGAMPSESSVALVERLQIKVWRQRVRKFPVDGGPKGASMAGHKSRSTPY